MVAAAGDPQRAVGSDRRRAARIPVAVEPGKTAAGKSLRAIEPAAAAAGVAKGEIIPGDGAIDREQPGEEFAYAGTRHGHDRSGAKGAAAPEQQGAPGDADRAGVIEG